MKYEWQTEYPDRYPPYTLTRIEDGKPDYYIVSIDPSGSPEDIVPYRDLGEILNELNRLAEINQNLLKNQRDNI